MIDRPKDQPDGVPGAGVRGATGFVEQISFDVAVVVVGRVEVADDPGRQAHATKNWAGNVERTITVRKLFKSPKNEAQPCTYNV